MPVAEDFTTLFLSHEGEIRAFVSSAVRDALVRDDILRQTERILRRAFDQYDRAYPFDFWARGIARNVILQYPRASARYPVMLDAGALDAVMVAYAETRADNPASYQAALERCLDEAPPKWRRVLELRYRMALGISDMAARLYSNLHALNQTLLRIRATLQVSVDDHLGRRGGEVGGGR